jgi:N-acetylglutamate synthase-like GNAT family acetyltransferase
MLCPVLLLHNHLLHPLKCPNIIAICLFIVAMALAAADNFKFRRFEKATDEAAVLKILAANIREEWSRYHGGKYLSNTEGYISSCLEEGSDLRSVDKVYFAKNGYFWVVSCCVNNEDTIVGVCGLEVVDNERGELRRMCLLPEYRRNGLGKKMVELVKDKARSLMLQLVFLTTPEHGEDVLAFYKNSGFVITGEGSEMHGTPIKEKVLEWKVE